MNMTCRHEQIMKSFDSDWSNRLNMTLGKFGKG